ncbi:DUF5658 family protein [Kaarinaea lacus]
MENIVSQQGVCEINNNSSAFFNERRGQRLERRVNKRKAAVQTVYRKRRKSVRRANDSLSNMYVDTHEPQIWYLSTGLMLLCVFDAFFTTILIRHGSEELNPILNYLLQIDLTLFLAAKFFLTGLSITFLVMHKHHRLLNTVSCYHLLIASVVIYMLLIFYELSMLRMLPHLV